MNNMSVGKGYSISDMFKLNAEYKIILFIIAELFEL